MSWRRLAAAKTRWPCLEKSKFDLVITDFEMPVMKGDELAAAIKARDPKQPVVMITAYAEMLQASGNPLTGVDFVISKPFLLENLREAIAKVTPLTARGRSEANVASLPAGLAVSARYPSFTRRRLRILHNLSE